MHAHLCIHSHIHMHSCACAYVRICIHAHMHTNTHEYTLIHAHYVCIHTCMHGHTNADIHRYTCTHTHTHTHTQPVLTPILLAQCTSGSILIFTGHTASLLLAQKPTPLLHAQLRKCREVVFSRLWLVFQIPLTTGLMRYVMIISVCLCSLKYQLLRRQDDQVWTMLCYSVLILHNMHC